MQDVREQVVVHGMSAGIGYMISLCQQCHQGWWSSPKSEGARPAVS